MSDLSLPEVKFSLEAVLDHFGPSELTDGAHNHLMWLLDLVNACMSDDTKESK